MASYIDNTSLNFQFPQGANWLNSVKNNAVDNVVGSLVAGAGATPTEIRRCAPGDANPDAVGHGVILTGEADSTLTNRQLEAVFAEAGEEFTVTMWVKATESESMFPCGGPCAKRTATLVDMQVEIAGQSIDIMAVRLFATMGGGRQHTFPYIAKNGSIEIATLDGLVPSTENVPIYTDAAVIPAPDTDAGISAQDVWTFITITAQTLPTGPGGELGTTYTMQTYTPGGEFKHLQTFGFPGSMHAWPDRAFVPSGAVNTYLFADAQTGAGGGHSFPGVVSSFRSYDHFIGEPDELEPIALADWECAHPAPTSEPTSDPTTAPTDLTPSPPAIAHGIGSSSEEEGLGAGLIAGIVIGALVFLSLIIGAVAFFVLRKKPSEANSGRTGGKFFAFDGDGIDANGEEMNERPDEQAAPALLVPEQDAPALLVPEASQDAAADMTNDVQASENADAGDL